MSESLEEVFSRLSVSEEERMDIMGHMGPLIRKSAGDSDMGKRVANLDLNVMFLIMGSASSEEELILACQTLMELLMYLEPSFILERYADAIERGLSKDTHVQVKIMVLKTLQRMNSEQVHLLSSYKSILSLATATIADPELSLAKETLNFLTKMSSQKIDLIFCDSIYPHLLGILDDSSKSNVINQLRVYELFIKIGSISQELLNRVVDTEIYNRLVQMAYSDDVLVKLNVLELLGDLAMTSQGYQYIVKDSGMSSKLDELLDLNNSLSAIVLPGILKFFGNLAYVEPKLIFSNHPKFLTALRSGLKAEDGNDPFYRASVETLGIIVKSQKGRDAIEETLNVSEVLEPIVRDIKKGNTENRVVAMEIFADFVNSESSESSFSMLAESSKVPAPAVLLQMMKLPFPEVQSAAYGILLNISHFPWGSRAIAEYPGFMEFILNRDTARSKEIKEKKFEVIKNILKTGESSISLVETYGTPIVIRMKEYVRDGPFYVKSEANVAYEEA